MDRKFRARRSLMPGDHVVERLAVAAGRQGLHPTAREYAETLWLLPHILRTSPPADETVAADGPETVPTPGPPGRPDTPPDPSPTSAPPAGPRPGDDAVPADPPPAGDQPEHQDLPSGWAPAAGLPDPGPGGPVSRGLVLGVHDAPATERLALARAMRPLKQRRPTFGDGELDAAATAHQAAVTDLLLPVFKPRTDRWLDAAVVVDDAPSMVFSQQTTRDLLRVLHDLGAFRDIRVWHCDSERVKEKLWLRAENAGADLRHDPAELVDPGGRRILLVVSDCVGMGWRNGAMAQALDVWGRSAPVAVVQPLPQGMWEESGLDLTPVVLHSKGPATPNSDLSVESDEEPFDAQDAGGGPASMGVVVPIIELGPEWLARWTSLVAGQDRRPYHARAIFTGRMNPADWSDRLESGLPADDRTLVADFAERASPDALRLARLLAAAAPLTLPLMRVVQHAELSHSSSVTLREVMLSGLLEQHENESADPEETVYDFRGKTRDELMAGLTSRRALGVLRTVSRYLGARLDSNMDFLALLVRQHPSAHPDDIGRAFATVAVRVLLSVGGSYRELAARIQDVLEETRPKPEPVRTPETEVASAASRLETSGDAVMTSTIAVPVQLPPERPPGYEPLGWKTVPLKNPNFIGRDGMLNDMHVMLVNSGQTAVLLPRAFYGLGGVGKTQLAIEYAHRRKNEFDLVWWVAAEDPAEIRRSLVQLAELVGEPQAGDTNSTIQRVLAALNRPREQYRNWLVVFDNVGDPSTVEGLLPSPQKGRVLITTRESQWEEYGQAVRVDKFARSESVELLGQQGGPPSAEADADAVAEQLEDLPISLAQAAAWHRATGASFRQYLDILRDEVARRSGTTDTMGYPAHAAAAMSLAFQQLQKTSDQAALLLQLAAYFGPEWISLDLLHRGRLATDLTKSLGDILRDQAPLQRAVREIARWELARNDTRNLRFQVHRLVQHLLQTEMAPELRESVRHTVQTMIAYANPGNPDRIDPVEMRKHAQLSEHIVASGVIDSCDDEARQVVLDQIRYRYLVGDYETSLALATEAVEKWTTLDNADDPFLLIARRHRAGAIAALGDPAEALRIGQRVREDFERRFGRNHEHTMVTVTGVGRDLRALGNFDEAYRLDEENYRLQWQNPLLGPDDRLTLQTAGNLAVDLRMLGRYEDALDRDLQTMSATLNAFGPR
ncbi:MAG TPA: FxSxx-COOH system tetratricopeptide repeat protein, partial [Actinoplanes sp.]